MLSMTCHLFLFRLFGNIINPFWRLSTPGTLSHELYTWFKKTEWWITSFLLVKQNFKADVMCAFAYFSHQINTAAKINVWKQKKDKPSFIDFFIFYD